MATTKAPAKPGTKVATSGSKALTQKGLAMVKSQDAELAKAILAEGMKGDNFGKDDLAIPFLRILQKTNDQVNKKNVEAYIPGAEPGMFWNTSTREIYEGENQGVLLVPIAYTPSFIEWKSNRGGFVRDYGADSSIMLKTHRKGGDGPDKNLDYLPDEKTYVVGSGLYYCFLVDEESGDITEVIVTLSSTQRKKSKEWNGNIKSYKVPHPDNPSVLVKAPIFYRAYRATTVFEQNDQGDWMGWKITPDQDVQDLPNGLNILRSALEMKAMFEKGAKKVNHDEDVVDAEVTDADDEEI